MKPVWRGLAVVALTIAAVPALAARAAPAHHDFSGTWVMDLAKSQTSFITPSAATYTIVQRGDTLTVDCDCVSASGDAARTHRVMGIDGKAWKNASVMHGQDVETSSILSWDHDVLQMQTSAAMESSDVVESETWTMNPDGKSFVLYHDVAVSGADYASYTATFVRKP